MFKIATWNVNSLKVRCSQVHEWIKDNQVDVLGIQETKLEDSAFPKAYFEEAGYHISFTGQKTYNGVAWISRYPIEDPINAFPDYADEQKRVLAVTIQDIRFINLYIPNGQALDSPKYTYKLEWLEHMQEFVQQQMNHYSKLVILGDFNIAPEDIDVYDPKQWFGEVLVSEPERLAFAKLQSKGLTDIVRHQHPKEEYLYSWWDYRAAAFRRGMGLRIDHILLTENLTKTCIATGIDKEPRKHERPSDHAPVWASIMI
jgi:exodeoxyribonuclease III